MSKKQIICEEEEREKANSALAELIDVFNKYKLRAQDQVVVYGNLGYAIGAALDGVEGSEGPTLEELQQRYYTSPTLSVSLMLQGMLVTSWYDQIDSDNSTNKNNKGDK